MTKALHLAQLLTDSIQLNKRQGKTATMKHADTNAKIAPGRIKINQRRRDGFFMKNLMAVFLAFLVMDMLFTGVVWVAISTGLAMVLMVLLLVKWVREARNRHD